MKLTQLLKEDIGFKELARGLKSAFGDVSVRRNKRSIVVLLPWYDTAENVEKSATDALLDLGVEFDGISVEGDPGHAGSFRILNPVLGQQDNSTRVRADIRNDRFPSVRNS